MSAAGAGDRQGKDCSQQSLCISTVPGGQMSEVRAMHDSMDGGVRTASGTAVEEQLPGCTRAAKAKSAVFALLHFSNTGVFENCAVDPFTALAD